MKILTFIGPNQCYILITFTQKKLILVSFFRIIDAIEECATAVQSGSACDDSLQCSVECIVELLKSMQTLCSSDIDESTFNEQVTTAINNRYKQPEDADYTGPLTYQSMARLPAPYRDAVAHLRQNGFDSTSGSESDIEQNDQQEIRSNGSGDTEGPEDEQNSSSDEISSRMENGMNWLWPNLESQAMIRTDVDSDRQHAREFAKSMKNILVPKLLNLRTSVEVDEAMQEFASSICQQNSTNFSDLEYNLTTINADGIYLATYSALLLSYQLMKAGHYDDQKSDVVIPLTEQQFVISVQNAGVLVYLSSAWLCELYQSVLATNPLSLLQGKYDTTGCHCSLIDMLVDAGGLGSSKMMSEWQRLQSVAQVQIEPSSRQLAAKKLARRLLTCCWESMVTVLAVGLGEIEISRKSKIVALSKKTLRVKRGQKLNGEALYALSLEGLHSAATLSNSLNLQHLAGKILDLIATNVCRTTGPRISASHALSMDVVLSGGLALGSHSADCWMPVFSVCRHVSQLEHELFSSQQNSNISSNALHLRGGVDDKNSFSVGTGNDKLNLSSMPIDDDDDEMCIDVYSFLQAPLQNANATVTVILKPYDTSKDVFLTQNDTAKIFCALSQQTENLFSDASERLSLPALCQFLKSLCRASREQLYRSSSSNGYKKSWWLSRPWKQKPNSHPYSLLLHRIGDVTLKVFRGPRPLLHILKVWSITGPHLMDAACHKDRSISKRAIEYIHDIITAVLVEQSELPHFHFNEALLKPFENLLCMETCDIDVQDQIVACLYEIVEAHRTEIKSGWRPLFGTLRNARNRPLHISNVTDIFRVFLDSDNTLVFANAGLDCILCLLSYLEISGNNSNLQLDDIDSRPFEFLHDTLKFLERCASILSFMHNMPKCPSLHSTYKIKGISYTHIIDANIPNSMENFTYFGNEHLQNNNEQHMISYRSLHINKESITKIDELDRSSGVLKVWFLLLDGLTNSLIVCPSSHQAPIIQSIFKSFRNLIFSPGIDFGFYCINHLLIPMIQDWLRYINKTQKCWLPIEKNFKHCCGMTTDLVVEFIEQSQKIKLENSNSSQKNKFTKISRPVDNLKFADLKNNKNDTSSSSSDDHTNENETSSSSRDNSPNKIPTAATLSLKQLLLVLVECAAQAQESIARVGVSCLKHIILSTGHIFNEEQWMVACSAIHRACSVTIAPLRQLSFAFNEKSNSFYGDCATVKVAARRDSTIEELARVHSLAQQVFLLDTQRESSSSNSSTRHSEYKTPPDDRSFSFLLCPLNFYGQNVDSFMIRIPFRTLTVGLLAHQMLLQLVANLLLGRLKSIPPTIHECIFTSYATNNVSKSEFDFGFRPKEILLRCIRQYIISALEFDSRPGLKFLMQKVSNIEYAANLYKQMNSSWMVYFLALVDSYLNDIEGYKLSVDDLKYILESCTKVNINTVKKKENFVRYLFFLQDSLNTIADLYLNSTNVHSTTIENNITNENNKNNSDKQKTNIEVDDNEKDHNDGESSDDTETLPEADEEGKSISSSASMEESISVSSINGTSSRTNPFDSNRIIKSDSSEINQVVSPEIEQQRVSSIMKDNNYRKTALTQLMVASMELIKMLPEESAQNIEILLTPSVREAFRQIEAQNSDTKDGRY